MSVIAIMSANAVETVTMMAIEIHSVRAPARRIARGPSGQRLQMEMHTTS